MNTPPIWFTTIGLTMTSSVFGVTTALAGMYPFWGKKKRYCWALFLAYAFACMIAGTK
jgi:predicted membrane protein